MWLRSARLVLPDRILERGSLRIEGEQIAVIVEGDGQLAADVSVDAAGLTILPGIVDVHGDMLERDVEPRPGVYFPVDLALIELDKRLVGAGITTAFAAISFMDGPSGAATRSLDRACQIIATIEQLRPTLMVDLRVHARYEFSSAVAAPAVLEMIAGGKIDLVSIMDHTPGQGQYRDVAKYAEVIEQWRKISRQEADQMVEARLRTGLARNHDWEDARLIAEAARRSGLTVASHDDDTAEKVERMIGLGVHFSEFPVTVEAARHARARGLRVAMGAPNLLLGGSHNGNLSARAAVEAGLVDLLLADYYPAALLQATFILERCGLLPLPEAAKLVSLNPARAAGLTDRGSLEVGALADLILVEAGARPRVHGTLRRGRPVFWDGFLATRRAGEDRAES